MYKTIKGLIPSSLRNKLIMSILDKRYNRIIEKINSEKNNFEKRVFILGAPEHGNLGDHAIIHAQKAFFSQLYPEHKVFEIPFKMITFRMVDLKKMIAEEDLVVVMGGGYMGSLWPKNEDFIRKIVNNFLNNKVIVFPQTAYYEDNKFSQNYLAESLKTYNNHPNLYLTAREKTSYHLFEKYYNEANNLLTPDIGLFLDEYKKDVSREGVLICLRKDREKVTDSSFLDTVQSLVAKYNLKSTTTDTVLNRPVFEKDREQLLEKKLNQFRESKIVVTDRLHGMIFAAVTGTPCIALDNKTGKVKGVYEWIQDYNYITLLDKVENLEEAFVDLINLDEPNLDVHQLRKKFKPLMDAIETEKTVSL